VVYVINELPKKQEDISELTATYIRLESLHAQEYLIKEDADYIESSGNMMTDNDDQMLINQEF
jgi:hypothetical protein